MGGAEAAAAGAVAAGAQAAATGGLTLATEAATVAAEGFAAAFALTGVGTVVVLLAAIVAGLFAYSRASEQTKQRTAQIVEALFRYTTPVGLAITFTQKLYEKFAIIRTILDPLIDGVKALTDWVEKNCRAGLEWIGILDTQAEKLSKLAKQEFTRGEALRQQADAEISYLPAIGIAEKQLTQDRLAGINKSIEQAALRFKAFKEANQAESDAIKARDKAGEELSDKQKKLLADPAEREKTLTDLLTKQQTVKNEAYERDRAARAAKAADIENNTERAIFASRRRLEEAIANEKAALQSRLSMLDRGLALVQRNSDEELDLQRKRILVQRDLELLNLGPTLAQERAERQKFLGLRLTDQERLKQLELEKEGLTGQQRQHIADE